MAKVSFRTEWMNPGTGADVGSTNLEYRVPAHVVPQLLTMVFMVARQFTSARFAPRRITQTTRQIFGSDTVLVVWERVR